MCINCGIPLPVNPRTARQLNLPVDALLSHSDITKIILSYTIQRSHDDRSRMTVLKSIEGLRLFTYELDEIELQDMATFLHMSDYDELFMITLRECNYTTMNSWSMSLVGDEYIDEVRVRKGSLFRISPTVSVSRDDKSTIKCHDYCNWSSLLIEDEGFMLYVVTANPQEMTNVIYRKIHDMKLTIPKLEVWNRMKSCVKITNMNLINALI